MNSPAFGGDTAVGGGASSVGGGGDSASGRDYPVLLGCTLVVALATILGNLIADITYARVDPRVRLA